MSTQRQDQEANAAIRPCTEILGIPEDFMFRSIKEMAGESIRWNAYTLPVAVGWAKLGRLHGLLAERFAKSDWKSLWGKAVGFENRKLKTRLLVGSGNEFTGTNNPKASNVTAKGKDAPSRQWIGCPIMQAPLLNIGKVAQAPGDDEWRNWVCLYHFDLESGEVRWEVSLARNIDDDGFIDAWWEQKQMAPIPIPKQSEEEDVASEEVFGETEITIFREGE